MKHLYTLKCLAVASSLSLLISFLPHVVNADTLHVSSNITPEQMVQEILIGGGVITSNITYSGATISRGEFWGGPGNIGIEEGILLTSGNVTIAKGPNNQGNAGAGSGGGSDPDLQAIAGVQIFDACVLEFDFIPQSNVVSFRYVFGSEEYHEYVDYSYNDAFGFFISGPGISGPYSNNSKNIALIPLTSTPVSINTVNCGPSYNCADFCDNCQYFVNNNQNFTQYDAFTKVLSAWANVIPCETYHIKLAIGDGGDNAYDSGVFLEANSFSSVGIANTTEFTHDEVDYLIEGCNNTEILFQLSVQPDADFYMPLYISGSAINGVDYEEIPDSVFFPEGYSQATLTINTIADGMSEWNENVRLVYNSSLCDVDYDTINIMLKDYSLVLNMTDDTTINCATDATIGVESVVGVGPYSYIWSTGDTTTSINVSPLITTTYYVTVFALCDSSTTDSVTVFVNGPAANAGQDQSIPYEWTATLQGSAGQGSGDYSFYWSPAALLDDPTSPTPTTVPMVNTTQFSLMVTDQAGGCQDLDHVMVIVTGGPLNVGPVAEPSMVCPGEASQIYAYAAGGSDEYTYSWSSDPPGFTSELANPVVMPQQTTTYYVMVNDGSNFVNGQVTVTVHTLPVAEAGENDTIFHGTIGKLFGSATLGSGNYSWAWEPAAKLVNPNAQNPTTVKLYETTLFRLTVTDNTTGCVCAEEDLATVVVNGGALAVTAEATDPLICGGGSTQLHALPSGGNPEYTYSWTSSPAGFTSTDSDPVVTPEVTTTYYLVVNDGFNETEAQATVVVSQTPLVDLGNDVTACPLDTVYLSTNIPGMSYYWSNGSQEPGIKIGTTGIGFDLKTVWVAVENEDGCIGTDTIRVIFDFAQCNSVEEQVSNVFLYLYPNPTNGKVSYEWQGMYGNVELSVSDLHGNKILKQEILSSPSGEYKGFFNLAGHPEGIYLVRFISNNNVIVRKILLQ